MTREWPRLRFRDGGKLDLMERVPEYQQADFEAKWHTAGVRVEWLHSYKGRLDPALELSERYVTRFRKQGRLSPCSERNVTAQRPETTRYET